jgi:hypothetical protein
MMENDKEYLPPEWRQKLDSLNQEKVVKDIAYSNDKDYFIKEDEVALKHPRTGAVVKLTDDGFVDIFAGTTLGIRLDPKSNSINFFGDTMNFVTKQMNIVTKPNGLCWNGYYFNPELYIENDTERTQMLMGTKEYYHETHEPDPEDRRIEWHRDTWGIQPMVRTGAKRRYSEGMVKLLEDMGLPTE